MPDTAEIGIRVWGDYACFSRPEFKVERVSYPVITPSAARGVLEAIFWKPEIRYEIREIQVLRIGGQTTILRNELESRQGKEPLFIEAERQQRSSLILKDVEYLIRGVIRLRSHTKEPIPKYLCQFNRRVEKGQCFHRPYLGTREFAADFGEVTGQERPEPISQHLGTMLFDIAFVKANKLETKETLDFWEHGESRRKVTGRAHALFFDAKLSEGRLPVPAEKYDELYALERAHA